MRTPALTRRSTMRVAASGETWRESLRPVNRDERRAAVDDFLENGPDDLGPASGIATVEFHNASLDSGGYCR